MKKLSETLTELGIAFTFPIEIKDANGRVTYFALSNGYWCRREYDARGYKTYYENSTGVKKGTPKASIILDEEESIRFAEMLKAAPTPPTPEFKRALRAYRDSGIERELFS